MCKEFRRAKVLKIKKGTAMQKLPPQVKKYLEGLIKPSHAETKYVVGKLLFPICFVVYNTCPVRGGGSVMIIYELNIR